MLEQIIHSNVCIAEKMEQILEAWHEHFGGEAQSLARDVAFTEDEMIVSLADGRRIAVPLAWFPRLADASREQLENWELLGDGEGIHWPELDEDISVTGLLRGETAAD